MNIVRRIVNIFCASIIAIIGIYFTISVCILFFIFTGQLTVGYKSAGELAIPTVLHLVLFQGISFFIMAGCVLVRAKVGKQYDFKFLQPKST